MSQINECVYGLLHEHVVKISLGVVHENCEYGTGPWFILDQPSSSFIRMERPTPETGEIKHSVSTRYTYQTDRSIYVQGLH